MFVVCSEIVLVSYYMTLIVGVLSLQEVSIETVGSAAIKIVIAAFAVNVIFSLYQLFEIIYVKYCKKNVSVVPINFPHVERGNVTKVFETEGPIESSFNRSDSVLTKNLFVKREEKKKEVATEMVTRKK